MAPRKGVKRRKELKEMRKLSDSHSKLEIKLKRLEKVVGSVTNFLAKNFKQFRPEVGVSEDVVPPTSPAESVPNFPEEPLQIESEDLTELTELNLNPMAKVEAIFDEEDNDMAPENDQFLPEVGAEEVEIESALDVQPEAEPSNADAAVKMNPLLGLLKEVHVRLEISPLTQLLSIPSTTEDETETKPPLDRNLVHNSRWKPPQSLRCNACGERFLSPPNLKSHVEQNHPDKRQFMCKLCHNTFSNKWNLQKHNQIAKCDKRGHKKPKPRPKPTHPTRPKQFGCELCPGKFVSKGALLRHIGQIHPEVKPFGCGLCPKRFAWRSTLLRHVCLKHPDVNPFECGFWDVGVRGNLGMESMEMDEGCENLKMKLFLCYFCGRGCTRKGGLFKHLKRRHLGEWTEVKKTKIKVIAENRLED